MQERVLRQFIREVLMEAEFVPDWKKKEYYNMAATGLKIGKGGKEGKGNSNSKDKIFEGNDDAQKIVELIEKINKGKFYYHKSEKDSGILNSKRNIEEGNVPPGTAISAFLSAIKNWMNGVSGSYENIIKRSHGSKSEITLEKAKEIKDFIKMHNNDLYYAISDIREYFFKLLDEAGMSVEINSFDWFALI